MPKHCAWHLWPSEHWPWKHLKRCVSGLPAGSHTLLSLAPGGTSLSLPGSSLLITPAIPHGIYNNHSLDLACNQRSFRAISASNRGSELPAPRRRTRLAEGNVRTYSKTKNNKALLETSVSKSARLEHLKTDETEDNDLKLIL